MRSYKISNSASPTTVRGQRVVSILLASAALLLGACSDGVGPGTDGPPSAITQLPRALSAAEVEAIRASNSFGLALLREVTAALPDSNVVLSPLSASVALGMAYAGAEGTTADAMRSTLGWGTATRAQVLDGYRALPALLSSLDPSVQFGIANAMWVRNGFAVLPTYTSEMQSVFSADVRTGDFGPATVAEMNSWASQKTNGRIPRIVDNLDGDMVALLVNALYFKGNWRDRFDASRTSNLVFTTSRGATPNVPTMRREDTLAYVRANGAQWVELPYGNTAFSMTLVLPENNVTARSWLTTVTVADYASALSSMRNQRVSLQLPKFRLNVGYQLKNHLTAMGMGVAFGTAANFSRISANDRLLLTHVKQDVFIDVNEAGTEAAAVTQVGVGVVSAPLTQVMHLDRPFLFFIRERLSGTILFAGVITEPRVASGS